MHGLRSTACRMVVVGERMKVNSVVGQESISFANVP